MFERTRLRQAREKKEEIKENRRKKKKGFYLLNCSKLIMFERGEVEACQDKKGEKEEKEGEEKREEKEEEK